MDLEEGQTQREEILTNDDALLNYAANRGMEMDQARAQIETEHADAQKQMDQLQAYIGSPTAPGQVRGRREAMAASGIKQRRVKPYGKTVATGRMEGEGPPVATPEAPRQPYFHTHQGTG